MRLRVSACMYSGNRFWDQPGHLWVRQFDQTDRSLHRILSRFVRQGQALAFQELYQIPVAAALCGVFHGHRSVRPCRYPDQVCQSGLAWNEVVSFPCPNTKLIHKHMWCRFACLIFWLYWTFCPLHSVVILYHTMDEMTSKNAVKFNIPKGFRPYS